MAEFIFYEYVPFFLIKEVLMVYFNLSLFFKTAVLFYEGFYFW